MGKLWSKHASRRRENPEGDSFVVNAFLRRGMEECETYSATDHKLKNMLVQTNFYFLISLLILHRSYNSLV
ncbi:Protein naked cuticle 2-like [Xenotaenia resolanae]|uniref:Protein naked cuticle 2-like n=1 Tax=Xenotaenia resolanae TaxID=208358 RepID=A0ABV0VRC3_9TELE